MIIAVSYGGKWDIVNAVNKSNLKSNQKKKFTEKDLEENLEISDFPNPDLVIRTGGEKRLSNFYLWQSSYSELYFSDKLWPDFTKKDLKRQKWEYNKDGYQLYQEFHHDQAINY